MPSYPPRISILLPVKDGLPYLEECLRSVEAQSLKDWEMIAVDDHSRDGSADFLRSKAERDSRIRIFDSPGHGILPAMDLAYEKSRGRIITRLDADDLMKENKLNRMHEKLQSVGPGHVITSKIEYIASGKPLEGGYKRYQEWINNRCEREDHDQHIYEECVLPSPNWMIYRHDLDRVKSFSDQRYPEDYDLCFQFYKHGIEIVPLPDVLHTWRDHPARNTRTNPIYSDPTYFGIKTDYFMELERDNNRPLVLYGAGVKGKKLARLWLDQNISFHWTCSTRSKWGHRIYGEIIRSPAEISFSKTQTIIAISAPRGRRQVDDEMRERNLEVSVHYIHFC